MMHTVSVTGSPRPCQAARHNIRVISALRRLGVAADSAAESAGRRTTEPRPVSAGRSGSAQPAQTT